jgi:flagellar hook-associated protein 1 FlgK
MSDFEARMAATGAPLDEELSKLWVGLQRVAAMPTDSLVRDAAIQAARNLADSVRRRAAETAAARGDADARVADGARSATTLAAEIAGLNKAIATSNDPVLRDRRDDAAGRLAELVGGSGRIDPDGKMRWVLADGAVLVDGDRAASVATTLESATGFRRVEIVDGASRRDVTTSFTGGSLGANLAFRDVEGAAAVESLDQFAFDLATAMNGVHAGGAGLDGVSGRNLFSTSATVSGSAAALDVDPAVAADSRRLASGTPGRGPGDNQGALALLALRDQPIAGGGTRTLGDAAIAVLGDVGMRAAETEAAASRDAAVSDHLAGLRDSLAGVDLDEELSKLVQFQHASEAMTRFLGTIDGMLEDLLRRI